MPKGYVETKAYEALKIARGNRSLATRILCELAVDDDRLLADLARPFLRAIASHAVAWTARRVLRRRRAGLGDRGTNLGPGEALETRGDTKGDTRGETWGGTRGGTRGRTAPDTHIDTLAGNVSERDDPGIDNSHEAAGSRSRNGGSADLERTARSAPERGHRPERREPDLREEILAALSNKSNHPAFGYDRTSFKASAPVGSTHKSSVRTLAKAFGRKRPVKPPRKIEWE